MHAAVDVERWQDWAACKGMNPDVFYPPDGVGEAFAKKFCRSCPVREQCLEYALVRREKDGIWGGMTTKERDRLARQLRAQALREGRIR